MKYHVPVLLTESIEGLEITPKGAYVDATFGGGGHSLAILKQLSGGNLLAFDQDPDALKNALDDSQFTLINHNFSYLQNFLSFHGFDKVDGILADLGVSSHHFDTAERGFSFRFEGDLDMRMDKDAKQTAKTIIAEYSAEQLSNLFREYGEIKNSYKLAKAIVASREEKAIQTTNELADLCKKFCIPKIENRYLSQVFQALRIEVNNEMTVLKDFLEAGLAVLKPGGRFVIITYHSLEDRLVKNFFKSGRTDGKAEKDFYGNLETPFKIISKKVIVPSKEELEINSRARSAKLRIAEKL